MSVPILTPENSFSYTCPDATCGQAFQALMPTAEIVNTPISAVVIYHMETFTCPRCGAAFRCHVTQVQSSYGVHPVVDNSIVQAGAMPLKFPRST